MFCVFVRSWVSQRYVEPQGKGIVYTEQTQRECDLTKEMGTAGFNSTMQNILGEWRRLRTCFCFD